MGVYTGKYTYEEIYKDFFSNKHSLATFEDKREYLLKEGVIPKKTSNELLTIQNIRNRIAHNYFLDTKMGFSDTKINYYGSVNHAIEIKLNYAWVLLMQIYNEHQVEIIKWSYGGKL